MSILTSRILYYTAYRRSTSSRIGYKHLLLNAICSGLITSGARLDYIADSGLDYLRIDAPSG